MEWVTVGGSVNISFIFKQWNTVLMSEEVHMIPHDHICPLTINLSFDLYFICFL